MAHYIPWLEAKTIEEEKQTQQKKKKKKIAKHLAASVTLFHQKSALQISKPPQIHIYRQPTVVPEPRICQVVIYFMLSVCALLINER